MEGVGPNNKIRIEISPAHIFFGGRGHNNVWGIEIIRSIKRETVIVMDDFWKTVKDEFETWKHYIY